MSLHILQNSTGVRKFSDKLDVLKVKYLLRPCNFNMSVEVER